MGFAGLVAKQPYRLGVRYLVPARKSHKVAEILAVVELIFHLVVTEIVKLTNDNCLEHGCDVVRTRAVFCIRGRHGPLYSIALVALL